MENTYEVDLCVGEGSKKFSIPYYYSVEDDGYFIVFNENITSKDKSTTVTLTTTQVDMVRDNIADILKGEV